MSKRLCLAALIVVILASRLPQLLSPRLLLDGDECILGLMAKHVGEGRELPLFFYGQSYGLAIVEAPAGALSFLMLGLGAVPLKLAMLAVWTTGVVFYFLALARLMPFRRAAWIVLLLILMPAWAVSSMKAWSGYLTAFAATGALLYLLTHRDAGYRSWAILGALTSLSYFAHPLWLPGVLPILLYRLLSTRRNASSLAWLSGIATTVVAIVLIRHANGATAASWSGPGLGNHDLWGSFSGLCAQILTNLTGSYYLHQRIEAGALSTTLAYIWLAALAVLPLLQIYRIVTGRTLLWSHLLFAGIVSTMVANWVLLDSRDARYMLPLNALLVLAAGVEASDFVDRYARWERWSLALIVCMLMLGAASMREFASFSYMWWPATGISEAKSLDTMIRVMTAKGVRHAFSTNALLQWQIAFYSDEAIVARWTADVDRYPPYIVEVNRALSDGEPVAIAGYIGYSGGLEREVNNPQAITNVDGRYFIYPRPDTELLRRLRFRIPN